MTVITDFISLSTEGYSEVVNITDKVAEMIEKSSVNDGIVTVFASGATAGITTTEFEPGLKQDIPEFLETIIPSSKTYHHDATWGDGNGFSHLRATLIGPSLTVPFSDKQMHIGTWQQIIVIDNDNRPRNREITVQIMGE